MAQADRGQRARQQHRGRGRGRPAGRRVQSTRDSFQASRLQDIEDATDNAIEPTEDPSEESVSESEDRLSEDDEDEADVTSNHQSYASLLRILNATKKAKEPPRKKRKVVEQENTGSEIVEPVSTKSKDQDVLEVNPEVVDAGLEEAVEDEDQHNSSELADEVDSDDETTLLRDPFQNHYAGIDDPVLTQAISAVKDKRKDLSNVTIGHTLRKTSLTYAGQTEGRQPLRNAGDLHLKRRLTKSGQHIIKKLSEEENDVASEIFSYRDVQFGERTADNAERLRNITCLHALNHMFKTRDRILKNNTKTGQQEEEDTANLRDQGFTRPKILFIVPTKQACAKFVDSIAQISGAEQQENKSRFLDTFSHEDAESWENKPDDFRELFGGNNEEDFRVGLKFTRKTIKYFSGFYNSDIILSSALGLMRTITTGGGTSKAKESKKTSHDADFLSSIEVVVVDHAAAIQMQNWQHLDYIFTQLNMLPKDSHGCDFSRVRNWYLDGHASYLRQTILFTSYHTPEINSLFTQHAHNIKGLAKYTPIYTGAMLNIPLSLPYTPVQTFLRIDSSKNIATPDLDSNTRFNYFTTTIVPQLVRSSYRSGTKISSAGTLIVIPAYADFTRLRNFLSTSATTTSLSFGSISEYTPIRDASRFRSHFMKNRHSVLLYTERAHHHFRYRLKGVNKILFYGVPENPVFWTEFLAMLADQANHVPSSSSSNGNAHDQVNGTSSSRGKGAIRALFSKWDAMKLERIVGTDRIGRMVGDRGAGASVGDVFEFM